MNSKEVYGLQIAFLTTIALIAWPNDGIRPMHLSDGSKAYVARCNGAGDTIDECYLKVSQLCGEFGYREVRTNKVRSQLGVSTAAGGSNSKGSLLGGVGVSQARIARSLVFKCGKNTTLETKWRKARLQAKDKRRRAHAKNQEDIRQILLIGGGVFVGGLIIALLMGYGPSP